MWCILGLGHDILHILEAILWPRGLPRADMSSQKQRGAESSLMSHKSFEQVLAKLLCGGSSEAIFGARKAIQGVFGAIVGAILAFW